MNTIVTTSTVSDSSLRTLQSSYDTIDIVGVTTITGSLVGISSIISSGQLVGLTLQNIVINDSAVESNNLLFLDESTIGNIDATSVSTLNGSTDEKSLVQSSTTILTWR